VGGVANGLELLVYDELVQFGIEEEVGVYEEAVLKGFELLVWEELGQVPNEEDVGN
jgi:hypothetical protein